MMNLIAMDFLMNVLTLNAVGLGSIADWLKEEAGNAIAIAIAIYGIWYGLFKQQWGKTIGIVAVAGFVWLAIGDTELVLNGIKNLWGLVFK